MFSNIQVYKTLTRIHVSKGTSLSVINTVSSVGFRHDFRLLAFYKYKDVLKICIIMLAIQCNTLTSIVGKPPMHTNESSVFTYASMGIVSFFHVDLNCFYFTENKLNT